MYYVDNEGIYYFENNERVYMLPDSGFEGIIEYIIENYHHQIGPNYVINNEEVIRLSNAILNIVAIASEECLNKSLKSLINCLSAYNSNLDYECAFYISEVCFRITQMLVGGYNSTYALNCIYEFSKDSLFKLYLLDKEYYRHIASALYALNGFLEYPAMCGFYDMRYTYDYSNATGNINGVDVDHIAVTGFFAHMGLQMSDEGFNVPEYEKYLRTCELLDEFWCVVEGMCKKRVNFASLKFELLRNKINDSEWNGLEFVIADILSKFNRQKKIAKKEGCAGWDAYVDRRAMLPSSRILLGLCFGSLILIMILVIIHSIIMGSIVSAGVFVIALVCSSGWILGYSEEKRCEIYKERYIKYELEQISIAAMYNTWYTPKYLNLNDYKKR